MDVHWTLLYFLERNFLIFLNILLAGTFYYELSKPRDRNGCPSFCSDLFRMRVAESGRLPKGTFSNIVSHIVLREREARARLFAREPPALLPAAQFFPQERRREKRGEDVAFSALSQRHPPIIRDDALVFDNNSSCLRAQGT